MSITGIRSVSGDISVKKSSNDSYETNIKKQIHTLEEKMKAISNDDEKPAEQKTKEKQAAQEQLQNLNQELREYQIRKQQEEAAKKQEAIKEALSDASQPQADTLSAGLDASETGVMVTLSSTHEQLSGMVRLRNDLQGKQRTAKTEEEKADLEKKINNLSRGIGKKMSAASDTISDHQKTVRKEDDNKQPKTEYGAKYGKEEVFWADAKPIEKNKSAAAADKPLLNNKNRPFDNISYVIK